MNLVVSRFLFKLPVAVIDNSLMLYTCYSRLEAKFKLVRAFLYLFSV